MHSNIPGAQDLRTKLKQREAAILEDLDDNEALIVEYHSPAGTVVEFGILLITRTPTTH